MYSRIKLACGQFTLIDNDCIHFNEIAWKGDPKYAESTVYDVYKKPCGQISLHRLIMKAKENEQVDHINGNKLDNRKINLRICTHSENMKNHKIVKNKNILTSKYKGVHYDKDEQKFRAQISVNGKKLWLGSFITEKEASEAYDKASVLYHGEFGFNNNTQVNIIEDWSIYPELIRPLVKKQHQQIQVWCSNSKIYSSIQAAAIDLNVKENTIIKACTDNKRIRRVRGCLLKYTGIKIPVIKQYDYLRK